MKRVAVLFFALCLLLSGCTNWIDGSYSSVKPHIDTDQTQNKTVTVSNYEELTAALISMIEGGTKSGIIPMQYSDDAAIHADMEKAIRDICKNDPFAAYTVNHIGYELSSSANRTAVSVQISYLQNRVSANQIQRVETQKQVEQLIAQQLKDCGSGVVLYFDTPEDVDYAQMVSDYALTYPQLVIEEPEVTVSCYPEMGQPQIVELRFSYQTSRAQLQSMQNQVAPFFTSAAQHVAGNWTDAAKYERLYSFLMGRYEYSIQTSITPAYSLLLHGEGDSRAFAVVYAAMCRQAGLECHVVTGTRDGSPWVWNAIRINGDYRYIDLIRCSQQREFHFHTQEEMTDYVWDYSAHSAS